MFIIHCSTVLNLPFDLKSIAFLSQKLSTESMFVLIRQIPGLYKLFIPNQMELFDQGKSSKLLTETTLCN